MIHISIIIPLYNKQESIVKTLDSVLKQTYDNFEIIIINDGSTDNSVNQALSINDSRIRLIQKANGGVCSARNRGIQEARYDYIALLDSDDLWDEYYLEEQVKLIHDFPEAKMWGINFAEMSNGKLIRALPTGLADGYRGYVKNYFQIKNRVSDLFHSSAVIIDKSAFEKVGLFDERIKYAEDLDMWYRIIANFQVAFYDKYLVYYIQDAENRALSKPIYLQDYLPYYIDKYTDYKWNKVFYEWINKWAAHRIRKYYFSNDKTQKKVAKKAARKLDYTVLPSKYKLLFNRFPYWIENILNNFDILYHKMINK